MGTKGGLLVESTDLDKNIATRNCQVGLPPGPQGLPPAEPRHDGLSSRRRLKRALASAP